MLETCPLNGNVCIDLLRKEVDLLVCFGVFYLDKTTFTDGYISLPMSMVTLWQTNSLLWKINIFRRSTIDGDYSWQIPKWSFAGKIMENPPKKMEGFGHF